MHVAFRVWTCVNVCSYVLSRSCVIDLFGQQWKSPIKLPSFSPADTHCTSQCLPKTNLITANQVSYCAVAKPGPRQTSFATAAFHATFVVAIARSATTIISHRHLVARTEHTDAQTMAHALCCCAQWLAKSRKIAFQRASQKPITGTPNFPSNFPFAFSNIKSKLSHL